MKDILALFRHDAEHLYGVDAPGASVPMTADKVKVLNGGGESAMEAGVSVPRERPVVKGDGKKRE
jgi:hypothetical protein